MLLQQYQLHNHFTGVSSGVMNRELPHFHFALHFHFLSKFYKFMFWYEIFFFSNPCLKKILFNLFLNLFVYLNSCIFWHLLD